MAATPYFTADTFDFLTDLAANNDRDWFEANRSRYEQHVKAPSLRLIDDFAAPLAEISPHFVATPKALFRIHRDTRFSPDKRPYKTHAGIHFRHARAKDVYAPGYYLHLEPGSVFLGLGIWHPDSATLGAIRERIADKPQAWKKASRGNEFREEFQLEGDRLTRPPKGFAPDHPLVDDLKLKDFIGIKRLTEDFALGPDLPRELAHLWAGGTPLMRFLCDAVGAPF